MGLKIITYRPQHQHQLVSSDPYGKFNCTAYSFAMMVDAVTIGGIKKTGKEIRAMSNEPVPDPKSPGLNIVQLEAIAKKMDFQLFDRTGNSWEQCLEYLQNGQRVILQLDSGDLGASACKVSDVGHAMLLQAAPDDYRPTEVLGNDPLCKEEKWYPRATLKKAAEHFARQTGINNGIRFAVSKVVPRVAIDD